MGRLSNLRLEVLLSAIDKVTAPLKRIQQASQAATAELKQARDKLAALNQQQRAIESFRAQQSAVQGQVEKLRALRAGLKSAKDAHASAQAAAQQHAGALQQHQSAVQQATTHLGTLRQQMRQAIQTHGAASEQAKQHRQAVRAQVEQVRHLRQAVRDAEQAQASAKAAAEAHTRQMKSAEQVIARATTAYEGQARALEVTRQRMRDLGITNVADAQRRLEEQTRAANDALEAQRQRLGALRDEHRRLTAAREQYSATRSRGADLQGAGASMIGAGVGLGLPVVKAVRDFASFEDAMLGVARQVPGAKDDGAKLTAVYGAVRDQVHALGREIPLTSNQIAEMITAGARMEVGKEAKSAEEMVQQLATFTRNAAAMAIAFDAVPDEIAEQMGKVAKNFGIPITSISGLADAINYLDDNAISKGDDIINVLNRVSGVMSTVKMSANDAAALGSTLLTLGDRPEVAATAINAITQKLAAATKGTKKFQAAVKDIGWSSAAIQKGMQTDATATYMELFKRLEKVAPDKRVGIMVELVELEHSDTLAKLANGADEFKRQLALANNEAAKGSMAREMASRQQALSAQFQTAKNRAYELTTTLGESLKPALLDLLGVVNPIIERMAAWARNNQGTVTVLMATAAAVAVVLAVMGTLTLAIGSLLAPIAIAVLAVKLLGIGSGATAFSVTGLASSLTGALANGINAAVTATQTWTLASLAWIRTNVFTMAGLKGLVASLTGPVVNGINGAKVAMLEAAAATRAWTLASLAWIRTNVFTMAGLKGLVASLTGPVVNGINGAKLAMLEAAAATRAWTLASLAWIRTNLLTMAGLRGLAASMAGSLVMGINAAAVAMRAFTASMLANPVTFFVALIATSAFLIYRYWQPISAFFSGVWDGIKAGLTPLAGIGATATAAFMPVINVIKVVWGWLSVIFKQVDDTGGAAQKLGFFFGQGIADVIVWVTKLVVAVFELPGKFFEVGSAMVQGMIRGIQAQASALKEAIMSVAGGTVDWFRDKLGIRSPSRVFAEVGAEIPAGAAMGIERSDAVRKAALAMAASAMVAMPALALPPAVQQVLPVLPKTTPQSLSSVAASVQPAATGAAPRGAAAPMPTIGAIHIHQQPGESSDALVARLERMIDQRMARAQQDAAARRRSSYIGD
jgi:TP901 family phage tail tape measure protein